MVFGLSFQENGDTALHVAVRRKDLEMMRLLVDHKGDVNQQNVSLDSCYHSQLVFALLIVAVGNELRIRLRSFYFSSCHI